MRGRGFFLLFFPFPASALAAAGAKISSEYEVELPLSDLQRTSSPSLRTSGLFSGPIFSMSLPPCCSLYLIAVLPEVDVSTLCRASFLVPPAGPFPLTSDWGSVSFSMSVGVFSDSSFSDAPF